MKIIGTPRSTFKAIYLEEGDYKRPPNHFKGEHVDAIFIPESEVDKYSQEVLMQFEANISVAGCYFGQIYTYKPIKKG